MKAWKKPVKRYNKWLKYRREEYIKGTPRNEIQTYFEWADNKEEKVITANVITETIESYPYRPGLKPRAVREMVFVGGIISLFFWAIIGWVIWLIFW